MNHAVPASSAWQALALIARFHQLPCSVPAFQHRFGEDPQPCDLLRAAQSLGFKAGLQTPSITQLHPSCLPALVQSKTGEWHVLAKRGEGRVLVHNPAHDLPEWLSVDDFSAQYQAELLLLTRRSAPLRDAMQRFNLRWFIPSLIKHRKLFRDVLIASFFLQLFALATPLFFQVVMDKVLVHKGFTTLDVLAFGFLVVAIFEALLGGIRNYVFSHTTHRVDVVLGARLFNHLLALPMAYFESRQVGQSVARVRELETIRNFITGTALTLVIDLAFTFVFFAVMWYYSPTLTCVVLATIPCYVLLSLFITPILRHRLDEKFRHGAENQSFLVESVTGIQTVKSMAVEPQMQRRWEDRLAQYVTASFRAQNLGNVAGQIAGFINKLMTLGIIWWGAHLVIDGQLTVGQLVAFNMIAGRVAGPILKLVQLWQDFQQAGISLERLGDILNTPREPGYNPSRSTLPSLKGEVVFDHVRFRYRPDGPAILHELSLTVKPGEVIGIVGQSGSGKSTLTKLIQRLYVPEAGRVLIDGVDLTMVDTAWLRKHIGVVLQENVLFNRSVRENIALANPGLPMEQVIAAAQLAGAHEFILELAEGYDTLIEEQGANLSGGQRQRVAIARALITNPKILILDEATSALDYESESIIQRNMAAITHNRTTFIIAHRLSTVRGCHRIIVMDKGRIVETGTHDELIKQGGYYHRLHSLQSAGVPPQPSPVPPQPAQPNTDKPGMRITHTFKGEPPFTIKRAGNAGGPIDGEGEPG
ncbi:MAG TPA: type I secretion system permease/ATPase [Pseudomonadales bacterium]